jgi:hypothetical protein
MYLLLCININMYQLSPIIMYIILLIKSKTLSIHILIFIYKKLIFNVKKFKLNSIYNIILTIKLNYRKYMFYF